MQDRDVRLPEAIVGAVLALALLAAGFLANPASAAPIVNAESAADGCAGTN
jgi:hypothetical protein